MRAATPWEALAEATTLATTKHAATIAKTYNSRVMKRRSKLAPGKRLEMLATTCAQHDLSRSECSTVEGRSNLPPRTVMATAPTVKMIT